MIFAFQLLVDVDERGRQFDAGLDGEAESMRLARIVVGVLSQNHDLDLVERRTVERLEDEASWRIDDAVRIGVFDELREFRKVGAGELVRKDAFPRFVYLDIHGGYCSTN